MKTRTLALATLVAAVLIAVAALSACGSSSDTPTTSGDVEVIAPSAFSVSDYAGKPLVINFFGSWCGPCNAEAPDLATFATDNPDAQIVGIAVDDSEGDAVAFMNEYGLSFPLVVDDQSLAGEYGITGVPTTIFFDAQGQETDRLVGASTLAQFDAGLAKSQ
ncbi:MAG: TlpA family protein disulfide reductase [Thermoleophilia bacterium]|nr:TlpA family protein disulfide reductase [Thermoleophilia bacterium]